MYVYPIMILCVVAGLILATPIIRPLRAYQLAHQRAKRGR